MNPAASGSAYAGRLAPAPTGALHLGNARTFLVAWLRARMGQGKLILRLEDLDHPKVKPEATRDLYLDLAWLGLDWDEGPAASFSSSKRGAAEAAVPDPYVQSNRLGLYASLLRRLREDGRLYPCVCTRKDIDSLQSAPNAGEDSRERRYPGLCLGRFADSAEALAAAGGREIGWRFRVGENRVTHFRDGFHGWQESVLSEWSGDFLVSRGDLAGYQLAVVADDHAMGVTEVVRGDDLLPSTHRQLVLYEALGYPPPAFYHLPLVVGPDGRRLAKRHGDTRLSALRKAGADPGKVLGWLARSLGWTSVLAETSLAEIRAGCDFDLIPKEKVVAEPEELRWMGFATGSIVAC